MDPLTHICSGVLVGQALRPPVDRRRTLFLVLGISAFAPDVDAVSYLWGAEAYYRFHHTYTHTFLGIVVLALLLASVERALTKAFSFGRLVALNLVGCTLHLVGDMVAIWPLPLLWPFRTQSFALRWTGDFDLAVLAVVGVSTGFAQVDALRPRAHWIIGGAVLLLIAYFIWIPGWAGLGPRS